MRLLFSGRPWAAHETWIPFTSPMLDDLSLGPAVDIHANHVPPYPEDVLCLHLAGTDRLTITSPLAEERVSWQSGEMCEVYNGVVTPHHLWYRTQTARDYLGRFYRNDTFVADGDELVGLVNMASVTVDDDEQVGRIAVELRLQLVDTRREVRILADLALLRYINRQLLLLMPAKAEEIHSVMALAEDTLSRLPAYLQRSIRHCAAGYYDLAEAERRALSHIRNPWLQDAYLADRDHLLERIPAEEVSVRFERTGNGDQIQFGFRTIRQRRSILPEFGLFFQEHLGFVPLDIRNNTRGKWQKFSALPEETKSFGERTWHYLTRSNGFDWIGGFLSRTDRSIRRRFSIFASLAEQLPAPGQYVAYLNFDRCSLA